MLFQLPLFLQSYTLNFLVEISLLRTLLPVSRTFQHLVREPATWAGLTIDLSHLSVPQEFYFQSRAMLISIAQAIVTLVQSWYAAQLGCPLWTTWHGLPPWHARRDRPHRLLGLDPPPVLSLEPVARTVAITLRWTGTLFHIEVGLTNAASMSQLEASQSSLNPRLHIRTICVVLCIQCPPSMALQLPGPWFVNNRSVGWGFPVDVSSFITHSRSMTHELVLKMQWTRSGIAIYSGQNRLCFQGFGPGYRRHYLETYMHLYADFFASRNVVASVVPTATYLGQGGLGIPNAFCFMCNEDDPGLASFQCSLCHMLYCSEHGGTLECACRFTSCGLCLLQHSCF